jgi:hypothetical protein
MALLSTSGLRGRATGFLSGYVWWVVLVMLIALGGLFTYHKVVTGLLGKELATAQTTVGQLRSSVAAKETQIQALTDTVAQQNKAIEGMVEAGRQASMAANKAIAAAKARAAKWEVEYRLILTAPPMSEDDCKALGITMEEYMLMRQREAETGGANVEVE